jgi:hypothetical protein
MTHNLPGPKALIWAYRCGYRAGSMREARPDLEPRNRSLRVAYSNGENDGRRDMPSRY